MERFQCSEERTGPPAAAIRWTLPNLLSLYRLLAAVPLGALVLAGLRGPFALLLLISLLSDALDGLLARLLHQQSAFGARLDNWADTATFWVALAGVMRFAAPAVRMHAIWLGLYALLMAVHSAVMVRRFGGIVGLHTWSFKLAAWLQGPAALLLLWSGVWSWVTSLALGCGFLAVLEELVILMLLREPRTDVRGLWWLWRQGALR
ncbi:MAG: CDP-alcohol phosphatidyltransferase family protein [Vulcanococcus sp.]